MSIEQARAQLGYPIAHLKPAAGAAAPTVASMTSSNGQVQAVQVRHDGTDTGSVVQVSTTRTDLPAARLDTTLPSILASLLLEASSQLDTAIIAQTWTEPSTPPELTMTN